MNGRNHRSSGPAPPRDTSPFDGILPVDKPAGPSSHDIVDRVRRTFGLRKVGHGGTLDPQATGLLILLIGRGTKLSNHFMGSDKAYEGCMHLGVATDSQDAQGRVLSEADAGDITREQVEEQFSERTGDMMQTPPMVSAVKIDGVPLYKRARKGQTVEREPRLIHVYEFTLVDFAPPLASFRIRCTKGTYVRTLCADIGEALGCGAHLAQLRRTRCGKIGLEEALPLDDVLRLPREELAQRIMPMRSFAGT